MKKIFWAKEAEYTYLDVEDFIYNSWGPEIVQRFQALVDRRLEDLKENPFIGKELYGLPYRQLVIHENTSIFYRVYEEHILLLAVWDNRQSPKRLLALLKRLK